MKYWILYDGRWKSVFISSDNLVKNNYGEIIGDIYNIRRLKSHKKLRLCWKNLTKHRANVYTSYGMSEEILREKYNGPFTVNW